MRTSRAAAVGLVVAALVAMPSVALAYGAADYTSSVSDTSPEVGQTVVFSFVGPPSAPVTFTIAGGPDGGASVSATGAGGRAAKTTDAAGRVEFSVTFSQAGTYTAVVTDGESGEVIASQAIVVGGVGPVRDAEQASVLGMTGSDPLLAGLGAGVLVAAGAGALVVSRRRAALAADID